MRGPKEGKVRKNEILDEAEKLFFAKGYEKTTINDVLSAVGISKGALYYYFDSKEAILDALVERRIAIGVTAAESIAADKSLTVLQRILYIILAQQSEKDQPNQIVEVLHQKNNAQMHQKVMRELVLRVSPILSGVIEQGIQEGVFSTPYPRESVEILLTAAQTIFDDAYFRWTQEELVVRVHAFLLAIERVLGAEESALLELAPVFSSLLQDV